MRTEHELKIRPEFYLRVATGQKSFEIRKNDRDYQVGDVLILREWREGDGYIDYSSPLRRQVVYASSYMQQPGYIVLGIEEIMEPTTPTKGD